MRVKNDKKNENLVNGPDPVTINVSQKQMIHNVFIVDASGSMSGTKYVNAINGLNELISGIEKDVYSDNTVMVVEFEDTNIKHTLPLTSVYPSKYAGMGTGGMTPLNQAIGETLEYVHNIRKDKFNVGDKVLVNIFTDGGENSSRGKYSDPYHLNTFIKQLENEGFTITFIGTDNEVKYAINTLGMSASNTMVHDNSASDISRSFMDTVLARASYSKSVSKGEDVKKGFYSKNLEENEK